jgi:dolichol-phosphate mannosyltransferase
MIEISVVAPMFGAANLVPEFVQRVSSTLQQLSVSYEMVLVDDGSNDGTWQALSQAAATIPELKCLRLSRNFGQHYAISAGIDHCNGQWIVVMDGDLQDRPEAIADLYHKAKTGWDIVLAIRIQRTDSWFKVKSAQLFYQALSLLSGKKIDHRIANFGIYHHKVIYQITRMRESIRYFPMMVQWVGFSSTTLPVKHGEKGGRKSGYTFSKLMKLGVDILLTFSDKPLQIIAALGIGISFSTMIAGCVLLYRYFNHAITVEGYTSLLLSIWFLSGLIIATLGIVGLYVGKIFEGIKQRPLYIIAQSINCKPHEN